jgi:hypothetical protein
MPGELSVLLATATGIAVLHTLAGPDHYLPFIALSKLRGWSVQKTIGWTLLCGCGHVGSSVVLGLAGAALGWSLSGLIGIENVRGGLASWALLIFGLLYFLWGLYRVRINKAHRHFDVEEDGIYVYEHRHGTAVRPDQKHAVTPWILFLIFLLGPCEPMIPLLYIPAAGASWWYFSVLVGVYLLCTLAAMLVMVLLGFYGIRLLHWQWVDKYMHALGGLSLVVCGVGMVVMGW